jgi:hypothetical protein
MGLDQYLTAKKYVSKWNYDDGFDNKTITQEFQDLLPMDTPDITKYGQFSGITVEYPVGYWRKANAIHKFFVSEVGEEVDDCREMWVNRDILVELRSRCDDVLKADNTEEMAQEVGLETVSGFFFGDTEYGDWYKEDLKLTVEICDFVLALPEEYSIHYQASW